MTAVDAMADARARHAIAHELSTTLVVEAAAGTGKTTELVTRMIGVLGAGLAEMRQIVAVTFTEKAAGELKLRLRERLEAERHQDTAPERVARLSQAVASLEEAHVSTIHGFCADLLRERPVEAGIDPLFRVLTEAQGHQMLAAVFDTWLRAHLEAPPEAVRRSLRRSGGASWRTSDDDEGPIDRLRRAVGDLAQWRDLQAAWHRPSWDRAGRIAALVEAVHRLAALTASGQARDTLVQDTAPVRALSEDLKAHHAAGATDDLDGLEARLVDLARNADLLRQRKGTGATFAQGVSRSEVLSARDGLLAELHAFRTEADADLAAALQPELLTCVEAFQEAKRAEGALDFLDLLLCARDLVRDNEDVRAHFQRRFSRIFVDEFQDTDPLQAELLMLLAADDSAQADWRAVRTVPGKLFVVGDPKQSIYRFRRADLSIYDSVCGQLEATGATRVLLTRSFRSVATMHRFVNHAFASVMDGRRDAQQARYAPLEPHRQDSPLQPAVIALPVPAPYGARLVSAREIERSLPDAVGALVEWLVTKSGWQVTERGESGARIPLESRHICILFRRFVSYGEDITRPYLDALEARGVRHLLVGGRAFHEREEIDTLRAALAAIEWPDDQLSVFATLRGALFAIADEDLLEFQHRGGRFHPFRSAPEALPEHLLPIVEALQLLGGLHAIRNHRPVADTIAALLMATRAHVGFALRPAGEQVLANVLHVAELARQYESDGGLSFRGFVDSLRDAALAPAAAEAPILEEGSEGVRLMTVHKAKGLEFPVVILADITAKLAQTEPSRTIDLERGLCALRLSGWSPHDLNLRREIERERDRAEGERLAYVAATRARDLLVVPAIGDGPYDGGWVSPLSSALYPPVERRRQPQPAEGCPTFLSKDTVAIRPDGDPARPTTVAPGAFTLGPDEAPYTVVWWSPEPGVLDLGVRPTSGLRRDDLIVKDVPAPTRHAYLEAYEAWTSGRAAMLAAASEPSLVVRTATEVAHDPAFPIDVQQILIETLEQRVERPGGPRFGSLVHAVLADMPLGNANRDAVAELATAHAVLLGATKEEEAAAIAVVATVQTHRLLEEAAEAERKGRCYRELPMTLKMGQVLVEGTVDLAYERNGQLVVVDFKTDRDVDDALDAYRRQVQIYVSALAEALRLPATGIILQV